MSKEIKNENVNPKTEEQQANVPAPEAPEAEKKPGKVKAFFEKHGGKVKTVLAIAGAVGVGMAADRFGLKIGNKKKADEPASEPEA